MMARDEHQFILAPWEHRGAHFDARPDFVVSLEIGGRERMFMLKVKQNALWFREAERGPEWTFGLFAPLENSSEAAKRWARDEFTVEWFESALRAGDFGRAVVRDGFEFYEGSFVFLFGPDGRALAREFWDERGVEFTWKTAAGFELEEFLDRPLAPFEQLARGLDEDPALCDAISAREVPAELRQNVPLQWLCGSQKELETLARNLAFLWWNWTQTSAIFHYASEGEHGGAALIGVWEGTTFTHRDRLAPQIRRLSDLFLDYHTPVGFEWEFQDAQGGRNSWEPGGIAIRVRVEPPSAHEKLEAALFLREWLRGKVAEAEIEELLDAPA